MAKASLGAASRAVASRQKVQRTRFVHTGASAAGAMHVAPAATGGTQHTLEYWQALAEALDINASKLMRTEAKLSEAVAKGDFTAAAILQRRKRRLQADDALCSTLRKLERLVAQEAYEQAAALRDAAYLPLVGWWHVQPCENDPHAHLVQVRDHHSLHANHGVAAAT